MSIRETPRRRPVESPQRGNKWRPMPITPGGVRPKSCDMASYTPPGIDSSVFKHLAHTAYLGFDLFLYKSLYSFYKTLILISPEYPKVLLKIRGRGQNAPSPYGHRFKPQNFLN
ncbi:hypothetical protein [Nostoc linckia]|nr:hypothetical protein [Nostoc linckia]